MVPFGTHRNLSLHSWLSFNTLTYPNSRSFFATDCRASATGGLYTDFPGSRRIAIPSGERQSKRSTTSSFGSRQQRGHEHILHSPHSSAMRRPQSPTLLSLLAIILSSTHTAHATPFPRDETIETQNSTLVERQCAFPCGYAPICCQAAGQCYTDSNNQAQCGSGGTQQANAGNNGQWQLYTTTYTETDLVLRTSTYSSQVQSATVQVAPAATMVCDPSMGERPCGTICCATGQYCQYQGQCAASSPNDVSSSYLASVMTTSAAGSAYIRPTSATTQTITSTGSATTTVPFQSAVPTGSTGPSTAGMASTTSNNGLTGGQIAGIVIGVLLGLLLLLLICGCLCFKGILDSFLAIFGLGPRKRRREVITEERYSHHHSGAGGGDGGRRWFGQGPARPQRQKQSSGLGGMMGVGAGLGALALILGLRRRREKRDKESYGTGSSYTYSDYISASEYF